MKSAFTNFFKNEEEQIIEKKNKSQKKLEEIKMQRDKKQQEAFNVVKEFVPHFANFDYDVSQSIDIIVEIAGKYDLSKEKISYFVTYLNSCSFTTKSNKFKQISESSEASNIFKKNEPKLGVLLYSSTFLKKENQLNLLTLNKMINKKLEKMLLKNELLKKNSVTMKERLLIWKKVLKYVSKTNFINYSFNFFSFYLNNIAKA